VTEEATEFKASNQNVVNLHGRLAPFPGIEVRSGIGANRVLKISAMGGQVIF
jgi:hypothetical protein